MRMVGIMQELDFPGWLKKTLLRTKYENMRGLCKSQGWNEMTYSNKNRYNSYTMKDIVEISYLLSDTSFLKKVLRNANKLKCKLDRRSLFSELFCTELKKNNMSVKSFCEAFNLDYRDYNLKIRKNTFTEEDKVFIIQSLKIEG